MKKSVKDILDDPRMIIVGKLDKKTQKSERFKTFTTLLDLIGKKHADEVEKLSASFGFKVKLKPVFKIMEE
jgi:hypothetical protein